MTDKQPRTLADMTPEEREQCVGMWCYLYDRICDYYGEPEPPTFEGIIAGYEGDEEAPARVLVRHPDPEIPLLEYEPCYVQPRFDLPRAWTPAGDPVPGEWADGHMWWGEDADTMQTVDLVGAECLTTGQVQGLGEWPEGVTPGEDVAVRRWVSDWEEIE